MVLEVTRVLLLLTVLVLLTALVRLVLLVLLVLLLLVVRDEVVVMAVVGTWLLGRHWEYQSFCFTQALPEVQQVGPLQPLPPHWVLYHRVRRDAPFSWLRGCSPVL